MILKRARLILLLLALRENASLNNAEARVESTTNSQGLDYEKVDTKHRQKGRNLRRPKLAGTVDALTRNLSKESEGKKVKKAKNGNSANHRSKEETKTTTKNPKALKSSKASKKARGNLQLTISEAKNARDQLQQAFNFDPVAAEICRSSSDDHQHCLFEVFTPGSDFLCECRPTSGARVFGKVDTNDDDHITWEEILTFIDQENCVFPFTYTVNGVAKTYNSCTSDADTFGFEWCAIKTNADGFMATGFWKYCDESSNRFAWEDALARLDSDNDGRLSFSEAITNTRRRRNLLLAPNNQMCNDCDVPDECLNPIIKAIDGECRNFIKTKPLDDKNLLRMLATTMADVYCDKEDPYQPDIGGDLNYLNCERKRDGMEQWLTRDEQNMQMLPNDSATSIFKVLYCIALIEYSEVESELGTFEVRPFLDTRLVAIYDTLTSLSDGQDADVIEECRESINNVTDGQHALQYATYTINQGEHEGKTILAFMGTKFNVEQLYADVSIVLSTVMGTDMIRAMASQATDVALRINPDFITGHSLGGYLAEMVCSETGIKGASFGALGAFDPFSVLDSTTISVPASSTEADDLKAKYRQMLEARDYDDEDIEELLSNLSGRDLAIRTGYKGLITETQHDGVEFEVVLNVYDIFARNFNIVADGSGCVHVARSCDLRWTWFDFDLEHTFGHSSLHYAFNVNSKWTKGGAPEANATIDYSEIFLPGVKKNVACDFCDRNDYCESGSCHLGQERCHEAGGRLPTSCPSDSKTPLQPSSCDEDNDCTSGRCDLHQDPGWAVLGYSQCYDRLGEGAWCDENSDCSSNYCNWLFTCTAQTSSWCYGDEEC